MPSPGGIYTSPYPGGWQNGQGGATPISAAALDDLDAGIKGALQAPTSPNDGDMPIWNATANGGLGGWDSTTNKKISRAQIGGLGVVDADISPGAAIQFSKLNGFPVNANVFARGDGIWAAPTAAQVTNAADKSSASPQIFTGALGISGTASGGPGQAGIFINTVIWASGAAATGLVGISTNGDGQARLNLHSDGSINFGDGTNVTDCALGRSAPGILQLTNTGLVSTSPTAGIGYAPGAGGAVTQASSKSTAVTLNKITGQITMNNASLAAGGTAAFTVNNAEIGAHDTVIVNLVSGYSGPYDVNAYGITAGTFVISVTNNTGAPATDALVLQFTIVKGANS